MAKLDFRPALKLLSGQRTVVVCGHVNPDGDSVGSVLALTYLLRKLGYEVTPLLATRDRPRVFDFLEGYEDLTPACEYEGKPDVFVSVDVPAIQRTGDGARVFERAKKSIAIDHHQGDGGFADVALVDDGAAAAGVLVWDFAAQAGVERDAALATCCYTALVTDTGRFQFQNADATTLQAASEMAAAGAVPADIALNVYQRETMASLKLRARALERMKFACEGRAVISYVTEEDFSELGALPEDGETLIDAVRELGDVDVVVMLREQGPVIRGSLRAKTDFDVSKVAVELGGGGHAAAAGFTVKEGFFEAEKHVLKLLSEALDAAGKKAFEGGAGR